MEKFVTNTQERAFPEATSSAPVSDPARAGGGGGGCGAGNGGNRGDGGIRLLLEILPASRHMCGGEGGEGSGVCWREREIEQGGGRRGREGRKEEGSEEEGREYQ